MNLRMLFFSFILLAIVMALGTYILSHAYFTATVVSANNTFTTAESFGTPTPTPGNDEPQSGNIVINEVSPEGGNDDDWIELFNASTETINIGGWSLEDNSSSDVIIGDIQIPAGEFAVVIASPSAITVPNGVLVINLGVATIGNGLAEGGDRIILRDNQNQIIDQMSYGTNETIFSLTIRSLSVGETINRVPNGVDTDAAVDWQVGASSLGLAN